MCTVHVKLAAAERITAGDMAGDREVVVSDNVRPFFRIFDR
jgi:hypothetical protein